MLEVMETIAAEGLLEFTMNGREPARLGNRDLWMAPHNCYKAAGDAEMWVSIAAGNETEWRALCAAIGQPSWPMTCALAARPCASATRTNWIG